MTEGRVYVPRVGWRVPVPVGGGGGRVKGKGTTWGRVIRHSDYLPGKRRLSLLLRQGSSGEKGYKDVLLHRQSLSCYFTDSTQDICISQGCSFPF